MKWTLWRSRLGRKWCWFVAPRLNALKPMRKPGGPRERVSSRWSARQEAVPEQFEIAAAHWRKGWSIRVSRVEKTGAASVGTKTAQSQSQSKAVRLSQSLLSGVMELHVSLADRTNLSGEIYRQLRQSILDGRLRAGDRLPPTRDLARQLSVARIRGRLRAIVERGLVTSRVGAARSEQRAGRGAAPEESRDRRSGHWAKGIIDVPEPFLRKPRHRFNFVIYLTTLFPHKAWRRLMVGGFMPSPRLATTVLQLATAGYANHRAPCRDLAGCQTSPATSSRPHSGALDIIARVLVERRPCCCGGSRYGPARLLFESLGCRVSGFPWTARNRRPAMPSDTRVRHAIAPVSSGHGDVASASIGAAGVGKPARCGDCRRRLRQRISLRRASD